MDGQRFDDLTRSLARGVSRRTLLKGLTGGVSGGMAALLGRHVVDAGQASCGNVVCAGLGDICADGCDCCVFGNGNSRCMTAKQCRRLGGTTESGGCPAGTTSCGGACLSAGQCCTAADCPAPTDPCQGAPTCDAAHSCVPAAPLGNDTACGNGGICCNGACVAGCAATDQCHGPGACDPTTGQCASPPLDGVPCDDGNACTQGDTCQQGQCVSGPAHVCTAQDQCHDAGECDSSTGVCSNPAKQDGSGCDDGNPCTINDTCQSGVCTGQPVDCDDGLSCTTDSCDPASGGCIHTLQAGFCLIANTCYADQDANPANPCQICDVGTATDQWTTAAQGTVCGPAASCTNGVLTTAATCNAAGACGVTHVSCDPYRTCNGDGTACASSCQDDSECVGAAYCDPNDHTCKGDQEIGASCTSASQCASGFCVDGYCCNSACTDQCAACNVAGSEGTCAPVTGAPVGDRPPCYNTGTDPACAGSCDGTTTTNCTYPGAETTCGDGPRCASNGLVEIGQDVCSGDGNCNIGGISSCLPYACVDGACASTCDDIDQCMPTASCIDHACVGQNLPNGAACASDYQCVSGLCPFGVCCIIGNDPTDCEDCFHQCPSDQLCRDHQCITPTTCTTDDDCAGKRCCNNTCVDRVANCTACGVACADPSGPCEAVTCENNSCVYTLQMTACREGTGECEMTAYCDGTSADCPPNPIFVGAPCNSNPCLEPYSGTCQADGSCGGGTPIMCPDDNDGLDCTSNVCDPATGHCVHQIDPNYCVINETCVPAGAPWNDSEGYFPCASCDPTQSQTQWTIKPDGTSCSDLDHCQANATCHAGLCIGEPIVTCVQPPDLCYHAVCDPQTGGCAVQPVGFNQYDQKGCQICSFCDGRGGCQAQSTVDCGLCGVCDPDTGQCAQAPEGTDCGSTCEWTAICDANGQCQIHSGGCLVNIAECDDWGCDQSTGKCVHTGAKNGQVCGPNKDTDKCHICQDGACVPTPCGHCEHCDLTSGSCQACESCCGGVCGQSECNGTCCSTSQTCVNPIGNPFCCSNAQACNGRCILNPMHCCDGQVADWCPPGRDCCYDHCCQTGETCCGQNLGGGGTCCPAGTTCCVADLIKGCCNANETCTTFGCILG